MNKKVLEEKNAMYSVLKKRRVGEEGREKVLKVYNLLKSSIPKELRKKCNFGYLIDKSQGYIKMKIYNYKTFLLPYNKNQVQIIYPEDKVNTLYGVLKEDRIKEVTSFCKFRDFPCYILYLTLDEVLRFKDENWECFSEACYLQSKAEKVKDVQGTVEINWEEKLSL
ncbi:hypothetical protein CLOACE_05650 [Clostridium acetireducens DSM 10703]|jgi:hypothetical protein|uniref:Uncharacterized protein n=1 Tax=Clostridium acetireducens DSM 10703 TaxID=1121290 RepID=A0A1E8F1E3_9CLOT|nr:hypothetical protein [Clostridium acetireducens]OFI06979.1 hypothetical protein CLOACE_05650 [Clostridium acetireducens DSM 10703]